MQILPYNRVLKDLNGNSPEELLEKVSKRFLLQFQKRKRDAKTKT